MADGRIPFDDAAFEAVVTNQVVEHIEDLDLALAEISRVLRPGGRVLSLFPHAGVWREGHCAIPFLHWFPKGSAARLTYAAALRSAGFGIFIGADNPRQWAAELCSWLDRFTFYRPLSEIRAAYARHFSPPSHFEHHYFDARLPRARILPAAVKRLIVRTLAGVVFVVSKPEADRT
jgi:SAM-dependent methyltransferase